jgi:hypothetical protein
VAASVTFPTMVPVCAKSGDERTDERMAIDRTER